MGDRVYALYGAPSIGPTQSLAPYAPRVLSPLSLDKFFPPNQLSNGMKVDKHVVNWARVLIKEVFLLPMTKEEVEYLVVNLVEDLIEKVYILPVEQDDVWAILHGEHKF